MDSTSFRHLLKKRKQNPFRMPKYIRKKMLTDSFSIMKHQTILIQSKARKTNKVIIYLHGGGYIFGAEVSTIYATTWPNTLITRAVADYPLPQPTMATDKSICRQPLQVSDTKRLHRYYTRWRFCRRWSGSCVV